MNSIDKLQYESECSEPVSSETMQHFRTGSFGTASWPERYTPPLAQPPARILMICEDKLISLDLILPIALELKTEKPSVEIDFVFLRRDSMAKVRENYILWSGMEAVGRIRFLSAGGYAPSSLPLRLLNILRVAREVATAYRRRTLIFYRGDFSSWPIALVALAARAGGGALIGFSKIAFPMSSALLRSHLNIESSSVHHRFQGDRHLLFHPLQRNEQRRISSAPMAVIGTPRCFPSWHAFLDKVIARRGICDIDGHRIDVASKPNILMFYPGNHELPDLDGPTACRDQMVRALSAIRRAAPGVRVLIKPHVFCDIQDLKRDVAAFPELEIRITFAHPLALARYATVFTVPNGTSVIDDMYVHGLPLIDASLYLPEIRAAEGSMFPNRGRMECTTDAELEDAFGMALQSPDKLPVPERGHLFWPKSPTISGLLWRQ